MRLKTKIFLLICFFNILLFSSLIFASPPMYQGVMFIHTKHEIMNAQEFPDYSFIRGFYVIGGDGVLQYTNSENSRSEPYFAIKKDKADMFIEEYDLILRAHYTSWQPHNYFDVEQIPSSINPLEELSEKRDALKKKYADDIKEIKIFGEKNNIPSLIVTNIFDIRKNHIYKYEIIAEEEAFLLKRSIHTQYLNQVIFLAILFIISLGILLTLFFLKIKRRGEL